ncbi:MAG: efflux RND transporter periplasmic adaptor subunit [Rikenellaceae bacterium]
MDRVIEQRKGIKRKHIPYIAAGVFVFLILGWLIFADHTPSIRVDAKSLSIEAAELGDFNDYVRVNGSVLPIYTVQLTPLEGGTVDEKIVEEGAEVKKGDIILRISNPQLNIAILESEASLAEKENFLRNTRVQMEQEKLQLRKDRLQIELDLVRKKRNFDQQKSLYDKGLQSKELYMQAEEDFVLTQKQAELNAERWKQDSIFRNVQVENMEINLTSMQRNMALVRQRIENLNVKSPIDGELGLLDVAIGQSVTSGQKLGQINDLSNFKIEAMVDEHYIDRVKEGLSGTFSRQGSDFAVRAVKVFPEVRQGQFRIWLYFDGERPDNIRSGQTYYINLELGQPTQGIIIPRGAFYQSSGGNYIFVVNENGNSASKRAIKIGRQNPQYYEVLEGLKDGEKVVISSYDTFGDNETLILK